MERAVLGLATDRGVLVLKPGEEATEYVKACQGLLNRKCPCLARLGDGRLAAGTADFFVHLSTDGQTWKASLEGLNRQNITSLARHPQHKHLFFAGTSTPAVFLSQDFGATWQALAPLESLTSASRWTARKSPYRARVSAVACHPEHAGVIIAGIEIGGLAASRDGGKSWVRRDEGLPPDVRQVITPPIAGRIYVGTGAGFYRSDDLGGTWVEMNKGLPYTQVQAMAVANGNPELIILSVSGKDEGLSAILQSTNGGQSWEMASHGLPRLDDRIISCLSFGRGGFYAGTNKGELFGLDNLEGRWIGLGSNYSPINAILPLA